MKKISITTFSLYSIQVIALLASPSYGSSPIVTQIQNRMNIGVNEDNPFPKADIVVPTYLQTPFASIALLVALGYLFVSMAILKYKYLYPTIEDMCQIFGDQKAYFARSFTFIFYHHIDMIVILLFSSITGM